MKYTRVPESELPANLRWDTPPQNQGQTVEAAYAHPHVKSSSDPACAGATYKRISDRNDQSVEYYRLSSEVSVGNDVEGTHGSRRLDDYDREDAEDAVLVSARMHVR